MKRTLFTPLKVDIIFSWNEEVSRIRSAGELVILAYSLVEIVWSIIRKLRGSNPQTRRHHMAKHNQVRTCVTKCVEIVNLWVVKPALLVLGLWEALPQP
jgi:hypothetical protein